MPDLPHVLDRAIEATVVLSFTDLGIAARRRLLRFRDLDTYDLTGRTVLVTGANSGLGYATARNLLAMGATVRMLVRSTAKGDDTVRRLVAATGSEDVTFRVADLADLDSVRAFADATLADVERLDAVVHNAGAMFDERTETVDGIERTLQVHVVAPFVLTSHLLLALTAAAPSRVITVTSGGMYAEQLRVRRLQSTRDYKPALAYARAKRAQVVLTQEWARRFGDAGIRFHTMHPGWAATPGVETAMPRFNTIMRPLLRDADEGADTAIWLVADDAALTSNGLLWHDRRARATHKVPWTRADAGEAQRLWDEVIRLAGVDPTTD